MNNIEFNQILEQSNVWHMLRPKTQQIYRKWFDRYIDFLQSVPSEDNTSIKIMGFLLNYKHFSPSTKQQAVSALRWMYQYILNEDIRPIHIKKAWILPERLTKHDIALELVKLPPKYQLLGWLFAGSGLKMSEALALRHKDIYMRQYIYCETRAFYNPLCLAAQQLYRALPNKTPENLIFPNQKRPNVQLSGNAFLAQCRRCHVDRRIIPSTLRANFILMALESHGEAWVQQATGLSTMRIKQYIAMSTRSR